MLVARSARHVGCQPGKPSGMLSKSPSFPTGRSREILVVIVLTLLGAVIRLWSPGRLGLIHFDEGIYALAGVWSLSPRGFAGIDPMVISYAPPGFPALVGLSYLVFYRVLGVRDFAAILVSIGSGILTIPVAAWLSRRTFGPGAGGAAAAFTALSGPHVAFSRMALTDASFLLCWLIAIGLGQRFLERPSFWRALLLGLGVGLAQLFKYSGWISGAIVAASAVTWLLLHPEEWRARSVAAIWGWGLFAATAAAIAYWPWFAFVDAHGGYGAILAHQRSYLGGLSSWPGHWSLQLAQEQFLSGGPPWPLCAGILAAAGMLISVGDFTLERRVVARIVVEAVGLTALCLICGSLWWPALVFILGAVVRGRGTITQSTTLLSVGFTTLSVMTPFYHPYARLWLPVEAFCWVLVGGLFVSIRSRVEVRGRSARWTTGCDDRSASLVHPVLRRRGGLILAHPVEATAHAPLGTKRLAAPRITNDCRPVTARLERVACLRSPGYFVLFGVRGRHCGEPPTRPGTPAGSRKLDLMGPARPGFDPAREYAGTRSRPIPRRLVGCERDSLNA